MTYPRTCRNALTLLVVLVLYATPAAAQSGTVKAEGQVLPGATVKATQGDRILLTLTGDNGEFQFDNMSPGQWIVEADLFGFDHLRREVQVGTSPTKIDLTLQLRTRAAGQQAAARNQDQAVEAENVDAQGGGQNAPFGVAVGAPLASADSSNESFLVNGTVSTGVQTNANDFGPGPGGFGPGGFGANGAGGPGGPDGGPGGANLAAGGPGGGGGGGGGGRGGGGFGGRGGGGGGGGRGGGRGGRGGRNPAFIGNRNPNNNRVTGSAFYTIGNSAVDARPFAVNGIPEPKAAFAQNRFGFSAGGPLAIPKLFNWSKVFWFLNYTGNLQRNGVDQAFNEPTQDMRKGDFSGLPETIYVPTGFATCGSGLSVNQPFPDNRIPLTCIGKPAQDLLQFLPLPNENLFTVNQNYRLIAANPNNAQNLNTRLNTTIGQKETLALTFNLQKRDSKSFEVYGCCDSLSGQGVNANLNWRHRFGARSFNNVTLAFNRNTNLTTPFFANKANFASSQFEVQGASPNPLNYGPPALSFTNFSTLSDTNAATSAVWSYGISDTLQLRRGKHTFSFGGGFTHYLNNAITDQNGRGSFSFSGLSTSGYGANGLPLANTGYDFADYLLGLPETSSIRYGDSSLYFRSNGYNAFAVDDFRVSSNLTLNLGLRYEFFTPWHEEYGHIANLAIAPDFSAVTQVCAVPFGACTGPQGYPAALIRSDTNNFGPRTGLAWKPRAKGSMVVRLGYGWYFNPSQYNKFMQQLGAQPPFATTNQSTTSLADPLTLATGLLNTAGKTVNNTSAVELNYRTSYAQTWNVLIQQNLPRRWVGELAYLGTKGTNLDIQQAPNQAKPGSALTSEQRLPIGYANGFLFDDPVGNSIYHALQVRLTRRFQRGISTNFQYTFSKAIDDLALAPNFSDQAQTRGLSANNQTHAVTANWVLASPVDATRGFLSHPAWVAKSLKDWTLSGSLTASTGLPLTATVAGNRDGTASVAPLYADATGLPVNSGSGYFNLAAFAVPPAGAFGNAGRDTITGPGVFTWNVSLARSINLKSERRRLEFRIDTTNTFNHVNPSGLITSVNSVQYGLITGAIQMRQVTATLRLRF